LDGILRVKDGGEVGRDPSWEVYVRASTPIVEINDYAGWVSDGVDEVSGDHFVRYLGVLWCSRAIIDQRKAMSITPIKGLVTV